MSKEDVSKFNTTQMGISRGGGELQHRKKIGKFFNNITVIKYAIKKYGVVSLVISAYVGTAQRGY